MACSCATGLATAQCSTATHTQQRSHAPALLPAPRAALIGSQRPASVQHRTRLSSLGGGPRAPRAPATSASALAASQMATLAVAGLGVKDLGGLTSALGFALAALFAARAWGQVTASPRLLA